MNRHPASRRAATLLGGALGGLLLLASVPARAQDGQGPTGDPVTAPGTNRQNPRANTSTRPRERVDEILPPVPASPNDPAPPGTNPEPVGRGARVPGTPQPGQAAGRTLRGPARNPAQRGIRVAEGVVVDISRPDSGDQAGQGRTNELVRLTIDPAQGWDDFVGSGPRAPDAGEAAPAARPRAEGEDAEQEQTRPADAGDAEAKDRPDDAEQAEPAPEDRPPTVDVVVTNRTRVFVHARSAGGVDMIGVATASSPDLEPSGVGVTGRVPGRPRATLQTNFTNIKVGSYVSIRYRDVRGVNEAVNVNLIELPLNPPDEGAELQGAPTGAPPVPADTAPTGATPGGVGSGGRPGPDPAVPGRPVPPGLPR